MFAIVLRAQVDDVPEHDMLLELAELRVGDVFGLEMELVRALQQVAEADKKRQRADKYTDHDIQG